MSERKICMYAHQLSAVISVAGDDAFEFLQGQFTNELRQEAGAAAYGLWLNQKGKVLGDSQVLRREEREFLVLSEETPAATIRSRLEQYIVADNVTLTEPGEGSHGLAVWGDGVEKLLRELAGAVPARGKYLEHDGALVFAGRRCATASFEFVGAAETVARWGARWRAAGAVAVEANEAEVARLAAGIPAIPRDIGPADLPNEGGLDETAISFTKGCYLGQEVMARLKNMGQVRRQLQPVSGPGAVPASGAPLFQGGRKAGEIRSGAAVDGGFIALALLTRLGLDARLGFGLTADGPVVVRALNHG
jgi:folate-binding protein YgfZ